ncbi:hypothetical protein [Streptomyces sp. NPDC099088]|uniref:Imm32 family immunity protein n=1 Tax=Streptomyces sp. NPDC099088 TaxID=3366101 RepID=UPI003824EEAA
MYSLETGEVELSGTRQGLMAFGQLLRGRAGKCSLSENLRPYPYESSLSGISFREAPERAAVSIMTEAHVLKIQGRRDALDLLADNLEDFASEADVSDHCHIDSPTYDYVAPESAPLVVALMD